MNSLFAYIFISISLLMIGCSKEDIPQESETAPYAKQAAQWATPEDTRLVDFERSNGWFSNTTPNLYTVLYSYSHELMRPLNRVALERAKSIERSLEGYLNPLSQFNGEDPYKGLGAQHYASVAQAAEAWIGASEVNFKKRQAAFLLDCQACQAYIAEGGKPNEIRALAYISAWKDLETLGFKDDATLGTKLPQTLELDFMKTEKGWKLVSTR